jgi:hypothetical protein
MTPLVTQRACQSTHKNSVSVPNLFVMDKIKYSHRTILAVIWALMLALSGCTFTKLITGQFEKPTFTFSRAELVETSQSGVIMNFLFIAHNPNEAGLKNITCSYELFVEGNKFLTGKDIPLELEPRGDTEINVPSAIAYADLYPVLGSVLRRILSGQKTIPITIVAVFSGRPAVYSEAGKETLIFFEKRLIKSAEIPLAQERRNNGQ